MCNMLHVLDKGKLISKIKIELLKKESEEYSKTEKGERWKNPRFLWFLIKSPFSAPGIFSFFFFFFQRRSFFGLLKSYPFLLSSSCSFTISLPFCSFKKKKEEEENRSWSFLSFLNFSLFWERRKREERQGRFGFGWVILGCFGNATFWIESLK